MRWPVLTLILAASFCFAGAHCPDPRLREAAIGGDTITGYVVQHKKPLTFAIVRLYSSPGKTAWVGTTDKNGSFTTTRMPPGEYRLAVAGWGSTRVQLNPELDKGFGGQIPAWHLSLMDDACVDTGMNMN